MTGRLSGSVVGVSWVNPLQIWGIGSVDFGTGTVNVTAYLPG